MRVRSFDIPPRKNHCGLVRVIWMGGNLGLYVGNASYYGWRWAILAGPVELLIWPVTL